jgi:hypothetical protein
MFALVAGMSSTAKAQDERSERSTLSAPIEGSWIFDVEAIDNPHHFTAVASFTAGGVAASSKTRTPTKETHHAVSQQTQRREH